MSTWTVLGLGTNMGDRQQHLRRAVRLLAQHLASMVCSPVYESAALLPSGAPQEWNLAFLNMAVAGETELSPDALLAIIKDAERQLGRTARGHWGPREIDIDILAYGAEVIDTPHLTIPHRDLLARDFALIPLADIAPDWLHPVAGKCARDLAKKISSQLTLTDRVIS